MKLITYLNAYSQGLSGGDACFLNVAKALGDKNDLKIITSNLGADLCKKHSIKAQYLITSKEKKFGNIYLTYFKRTINALVIPRPKGRCLLYSSSDFLPDVLPAFVLKILGRRRLWLQKIFHIIPSERGFVSVFQRLSFFLIRNTADLIIVDNAGLKDQLISQFHFSDKKIYVIPPGIDLASLEKIKPAKEKFDAVFVGQLRKSKGIFDLVPIWKEVIEKIPSATLAVIGKDVQGNQDVLKREITENGLDNKIKILGYLPANDAVYAYMKSARVLLLPSHEEGFGIVVLEALACAIPVVAYDLPALREHFAKGVRFSPLGDTGELARSTVHLLSQEGKKMEDWKEITKDFDTISVVNRELDLIQHAYKSTG
jgi:glycosyltransferase involved in cell wall biosynthesis